MFTIKQLQQKNLRELKAIAREFNIVPSGNQSYRQTWIDAVFYSANCPACRSINSLSAIWSHEFVSYFACTKCDVEPHELLEIPPDVEVEQVYELSDSDILSN
jgi:Zn ribbon nucleic-acid-binding protein